MNVLARLDTHRNNASPGRSRRRPPRATLALAAIPTLAGFALITTSPLHAEAATSGAVTIGGSMEGNLPVHPGDTLRAGYDFTMPGSHPAATVTVSAISVSLTVECGNGTSYPVTISMADATYSVGANDSSWFPSGDQSSTLVYQGSTSVPSTACDGHAPQGATFSATFSSTDTIDSVHIRFHYADNTAGSWSGTASITPGTPPPSNATLWVQKLDSCATTLPGAQLELLDSNGNVVSGPVTSAAGKLHSFAHTGCPVQGGSCTVTGTGCLTLSVPVPLSGTATFRIVEVQPPAGFVNCIKGDNACIQQFGVVVVSSAGTLQVTFTAAFTNGHTETLPSNDPNAGNAFWTGTQADPALYYDGTTKKK